MCRLEQHLYRASNRQEIDRSGSTAQSSAIEQINTDMKLVNALKKNTPPHKNIACTKTFCGGFLFRFMTLRVKKLHLECLLFLCNGWGR